MINSVTGEPLRKVALTLRKSGRDFDESVPRSVSTEADGRFLFEKLEPGTYNLYAERTGFLRRLYGTRASGSPGTPLTLSAGQHLKDIEFKLIPQGVISGKVLDEEGEPVPGGWVNVIRRGSTLSRSSMAFMSGATVNDVGEFRIAELSPGRYIVQVTASFGVFREPAPAKGDEPVEGFVPTFYPSATDSSGAVLIEVAPGQEVSGINITLRKGLLYRVQGKVANAPKNERLRVSLQPRNPEGMIGLGGAGVVKPDGSFEIASVQPGAYILTVMSYQGRPPAVLGSTPVDVMSSNVKDVVVTVGEPLSLSGVVRIEGQEKPTFGRCMIFLRPAGAVRFGAGRAEVKPDGTFTMEGVSRDKFSFQFTGFPEDAYVRSIRMGNQEVLEGLDLSQAPSSVQLELILSKKSATVEGLVLEDKKPAPGKGVWLIPDPAKAERMYLAKHTSSDQNGRFTIKGVAPGDYRLYAWEEMDYDLMRQPELLKPFENKGAKLTLPEGGHEQAELRVLIPDDGK